MIDYFFFIFCFLSFYNIKILGFDDFFIDYMELDNTNCIKGIFVWLIIFCHKSNYGDYKNHLFKTIIINFGQKVVSVFLFYSSFGIFESLKKKGINYIKTLPNKAIILFIKFQIILLMFLITNIFIFNSKISIKLYFLSVIFKYSLGNSNWFAFSIIIFYLYSYISFRFINNKLFAGIIIISFICILHLILVYNFYYPKATHAVDTVLCFIIGFYFSFLKINLDKVLLKNDICYFGIFSFLIIIYYKIYFINTLIYISIRNALFAILIVLISIKVKVKNDFLKFLNYHSYSIYLLQRLVLLVVYKKKIFYNSNFIQISFEFTTIFFIASLFDKYTLFIDKCFKNNLKVNNNKYIPIKIDYLNSIINKI